MRAGREGSRERGSNSNNKGKEEQRRALLEDKFQVILDYDDLFVTIALP